MCNDLELFKESPADSKTHTTGTYRHDILIHIMFKTKELYNLNGHDVLKSRRTKEKLYKTIVECKTTLKLFWVRIMTSRYSHRSVLVRQMKQKLSEEDSKMIALTKLKLSLTPNANTTRMIKYRLNMLIFSFQ